jgi:hypothetical protein
MWERLLIVGLTTLQYSKQTTTKMLQFRVQHKTLRFFSQICKKKARAQFSDDKKVIITKYNIHGKIHNAS